MRQTLKGRKCTTGSKRDQDMKRKGGCDFINTSPTVNCEWRGRTVACLAFKNKPSKAHFGIWYRSG